MLNQLINKDSHNVIGFILKENTQTIGFGITLPVVVGIINIFRHCVLNKFL